MTAAPTRIGIAGLGLIGGSLARALSASAGRFEVVGYDRSRASVRDAVACGAVSRGGTLKDLSLCDVVVVAVPVVASIPLVEKLAPMMATGSILTDAGSVKVPVVKAGQASIAKGAEFVGGHPIAGTERSGFAASDPTLFRGKTFVVTPTRKNSSEAVAVVSKLWESADAVVRRMAPKEHDHVFAYVSHLPHVVVYSLVHAVATRGERVPLGWSAGGFRDVTRIASSSPEMWRDILQQNRTEVLSAVRHYRRNLAILEKAVRDGDAEGLVDYFRTCKATRDKL